MEIRGGRQHQIQSADRQARTQTREKKCNRLPGPRVEAALSLALSGMCLIPLPPYLVYIPCPTLPSLSLPPNTIHIYSCMGWEAYHSSHLQQYYYMELELGLAPPNNLIEGLDLNTPTDFWGHGPPLCGTKRGFNEAFHTTCRAVIKTLPLFQNNELHCNDNNNGGVDDEDDDASSGIACKLALRQVNKRGIVGWPPIKSSRRLAGGDGGTDEDFETRRGNGGSNSMYVKVKMDGMAIGRKIDLALHQSYQTLTQALVCMFGIYENKDVGDAEKPSYRITYQDKEGDWLLVGDVPWVAFIRSVQRLQIQKNSR